MCLTLSFDFFCLSPPTEVMKQKDFDASIDIYSFGIVLWEIYTTEEPFSQYSEWEPFFNAVCVKNERPPIDDECPTSLKYLMEACWSAEPSKRPTFAEVVFRLGASSLQSLLISF